MNRFLKFTKLFVWILLLGLPARATIDQTDLLEIKAKLEDAITKKYNNRISTRIRSELFSVGAQVTLTVKKEMVDADSVDLRNSNSYFSELPADISLGIMGSLPKSADGTSPAIQPNRGGKVLREKIKIVEILVHVGLSPKLGKAYQDQFNLWLNANIKSEFAGIGKASVNNYMDLDPADKEDSKNAKTFELKMEPKSIEIKTQEPTSARLLGWEERFGQFQNFIGLAFLAVLLMITFIASKYIPSRDVNNQLAVAEKLAELRNSQTSNDEKEVGTSKSLQITKQVASQTLENEKGPARLLATYESFQEQQRKIAFLVLSSKENMDLVTQMWLEDGDFGRAKIALVLDCVLANIGKVESLSKASGEVSPALTLPDSIRTDKGLSKVFQSIATLDLDGKAELLDKAYWDLLSIQTLGIDLTKQRFSSFVALPASAIHTIMSAQDPKTKAVTYLHLPSEKLKVVLSTMALEDKKDILSEAFSHSNLTDSDLDQVNTSLNNIIQREKLKNSYTVNLPSLVPNLLAVTTPLEEIHLLGELMTAKPISTKFLMTNYPSMLFIQYWSPEQLKLLSGRFKNAQYLALIQAIPVLQDLILNVLPAKSQAMIKDDIGVKILTDDELNANLQEVRIQLMHLFENSEIDLTQLYETAMNSTTNVAA